MQFLIAAVMNQNMVVLAGKGCSFITIPFITNTCGKTHGLPYVMQYRIQKDFSLMFFSIFSMSARVFSGKTYPNNNAVCTIMVINVPPFVKSLILPAFHF